MSIQNILYLRGPDGSLRPVITASGHWIPAVLVPGTPLLSAVMAAEKKAAEDKKKAEEAKKKADEKRKRLAKFRWVYDPAILAARPLAWKEEELLKGMEWWYLKGTSGTYGPK